MLTTHDYTRQRSICTAALPYVVRSTIGYHRWASCLACQWRWLRFLRFSSKLLF